MDFAWLIELSSPASKLSILPAPEEDARVVILLNFKASFSLLQEFCSEGGFCSKNVTNSELKFESSSPHHLIDRFSVQLWPISARHSVTWQVREVRGRPMDSDRRLGARKAGREKKKVWGVRPARLTVQKGAQNSGIFYALETMSILGFQIDYWSLWQPWMKVALFWATWPSPVGADFDRTLSSPPSCAAISKMLQNLGKFPQQFFCKISLIRNMRLQTAEQGFLWGS